MGPTSRRLRHVRERVPAPAPQALQAPQKRQGNTGERTGRPHQHQPDILPAPVDQHARRVPTSQPEPDPGGADRGEDRDDLHPSQEIVHDREPDQRRQTVEQQQQQQQPDDNAGATECHASDPARASGLAPEFGMLRSGRLRQSGRPYPVHLDVPRELRTGRRRGSLQGFASVIALRCEGLFCMSFLYITPAPAPALRPWMRVGSFS